MVEMERMSINERRKYLYKMWERYRKASRKEKGYLLDEMQAVTGMHRKSLIRLMRGRLSRKRRSRERGRTYGATVEDAVRVIAHSLDYPCAERLKGALVPVALHLQRLGEVRLEPGEHFDLETHAQTGRAERGKTGLPQAAPPKAPLAAQRLPDAADCLGCGGCGTL